MPPLHLIADDLTGALDSAAAFAGPDRPVAVHWDGVPVGLAVGASVALDTGTRDIGDAAAARRRVTALATRLPDGEALRFAKLDSLLRGHGAAEIAAWMAVDRPDHCIVAPAFPFQGRVTRAGRQHIRDVDGWTAVATDLTAALEAEGERVRLCRPGDPVPPGVSLWDAETEADLAAIAATGLALSGRVLWCGSGGLAAALAAVMETGRGPAPSPDPFPRPLLGLFGTDHPVTMAQLTACGGDVLVLPDGGTASAARVAARLAERGAALVRLGLPDGLARDAAAERIGRELGALARRLVPPATLLVSGGETLRALCGALGAGRLDLDGALLPGVPGSTLRGGAWDGVRVVSKSGAFGDPSLLRRLIRGDTPDADRAAPEPTRHGTPWPHRGERA
ncbi:hypothetical protein Sp245p_23610 (plasmid) [Azospirillum baldaniorum]|uniref:four-carbon acid sugar kinase family protein n=1 Tax=Azospirillum baldaniorum TaxID=1064539 RepID=UPI000D6000C6|nr:four-carbon acid sugar kinase family protein [Azospirillum baldaniorum]AWJ92833.1 hypothetical protein Sp245p_23610 [Azospirillum baldaniorum]TWA78252.1 uncharacterized protein YgbK (DUF1537 family) [Azospirillum brasilense]